MRTFVLGAVAYDPKVVTIWDGFKAWFEQNGLPFDYVLFHNYERQVAAHFAGAIDVAWNSPLAWIQTERIAARLGRPARAVAMRDTDQDLTSVVVVRADDASLPDAQALAGRRVGVGAADSPQATLLPLWSLDRDGIEVEVVPHDHLHGKHGDHIGGERLAAEALLSGSLDAACLLDANLTGFAADGTLPAGSVRVVHRTPKFDHCAFTVLDVDADTLHTFLRLLYSMQWEDPSVRRLMELEGLREWREGRTLGYAPLDAACTRFGAVDAFVEAVASGRWS